MTGFIALIRQPLYQAIAFILISIPAVFALSPKNADGAWLIAAFCYLGFLIINTVVLWFTPQAWKYFFHSISYSVAYILIIAFMMPVIIKLLKLGGPQESAMAFLFIIYHPISLLIVMFAKWIYLKII